MTDVSNDNVADGIFPFEPDAHGHAALLLVESLIHALIDRGALSVAEAVDTVTTASDVNAELVADHKQPDATLRHSLSLLKVIGNSLRTDTVRQE